MSVVSNNGVHPDSLSHCGRLNRLRPRSQWNVCYAFDALMYTFRFFCIYSEYVFFGFSSRCVLYCFISFLEAFFAHTNFVILMVLTLLFSVQLP